MHVRSEQVRVQMSGLFASNDGAVDRYKREGGRRVRAVKERGRTYRLVFRNRIVPTTTVQLVVRHLLRRFRAQTFVRLSLVILGKGKKKDLEVLHRKSKHWCGKLESGGEAEDGRTLNPKSGTSRLLGGRVSRS